LKFLKFLLKKVLLKKMKKFLINEKEKNMRLDFFLVKKLSLSRNKCHFLIEETKKVLVNNKFKKKKYILKQNDEVTVLEENKVNQINKPLKPINLNLKIIYEDEFLVLINKPCDLIVHPAPSYSGVTLVNGLLYQINGLREIKSDRPGIIHRLDKDTTGLILIGKKENIIIQMQKLLKEKKIKRIYWALIHGFLANKGTINLPIKRDLKNRLRMSISANGRPSITHFKTLKRFKNFSLLELELETGRTHQIRIHLSYLKTPILGDPLYGKKDLNIKKQLLHSKKIFFLHPITKKYLKFEIPLPNTFQKILDILE
jgi:23S rRNA pseudouridine1911/1915/1917 synthase